MANKLAACIGLGGNIGDVRSNLVKALARLDATPETRVVNVSSLYRTPPWGLEDQPWFLNACALLETTLEPETLLAVCLDTERAFNRVRAERWGPRTVDIDILCYGDVQLKAEGLELPHPRISERAFVLKPLAEIAPTLEINGKTVLDWLKETDASKIERVDDRTDWWRQST